MSTDPDDKRLSYVPLDVLRQPPEGRYIQHFASCWWVVHPERGVLLWHHPGSGHGVPQCNRDGVLARRIQEKLYPWADLIQIEHAYLPIVWPIDN